MFRVYWELKLGGRVASSIPVEMGAMLMSRQQHEHAIVKRMWSVEWLLIQSQLACRQDLEFPGAEPFPIREPLAQAELHGIDVQRHFLRAKPLNKEYAAEEAEYEKQRQKELKREQPRFASVSVSICETG